MKLLRIQMLALAVMMAVIPLAAAQSSSTAAADKAELVKLDQEWLDAARNHNRAFCAQLWAPGFVEVIGHGVVLSREQLLDLISDKTRKGKPYVDDIHVANYYGDVAVVTDHTTLKGHDTGSKADLGGQYRVIRVYIKRHGKWRAIAAGLNMMSPSSQ
ncbi:MAG: nuclear transport factor 2 family protein [Terriglobia bacterium]